jgi:mannose-6-phosphate isomerase-like protein (cupin superfamily)
MRILRTGMLPLLVASLSVLAYSQARTPVTTVIPGDTLDEMLRQEPGDNPLRVVDSPDGQYGVFILTSEPRPAGDAVNGGYHRDVGEIYRVVRGTGIFVTGGELIDPQEVATDSLRYSRAGGGESGRLRNPELVEYGPGSIFIVPPGVPHNATHEVKTRTEFIIYRFDPKGVLPLH